MGIFLLISQSCNLFYDYKISRSDKFRPKKSIRCNSDRRTVVIVDDNGDNGDESVKIGATMTVAYHILSILRVIIIVMMIMNGPDRFLSVNNNLLNK